MSHLKQGVETVSKYTALGGFQEKSSDIKTQKTVSVANRRTKEDKLRFYLSASFFDLYRDNIIDFFVNLKVAYSLTRRDKKFSQKIARYILTRYTELIYEGTEFKVRLKAGAKGDARILPNNNTEIRELTENVLDDIIDFVHDLQADWNANEFAYEAFATFIADFFHSQYYTGSEASTAITDTIVTFIDKIATPFPLNDEEVMLEVVSFLAEKVRTDQDVQHALEEIEEIFMYDGRAGFPWKLSTVAPLARHYERRSDYSIIKVKGVREETPCTHNNCGGMFSVQNLIQIKATDEGKTLKRYCTKCNKERH